MKDTVFLENVETGIKRQIRWAEKNKTIKTEFERNVFLDLIIIFCQQLKKKPYKPSKSPKTRHG